MNVRGELAAAMAALNLTPTAAAPIERVLDSLASKPDAADYWAARGKSRYVTELTEDGLPLEVIDTVVNAVEDVLLPVRLDLDAILDELRRRWVAAEG